MPTERTLTELLIWYREMGVDAAVAPAPMDWLAAGSNVARAQDFVWPQAKSRETTAASPRHAGPQPGGRAPSPDRTFAPPSLRPPADPRAPPPAPPSPQATAPPAHQSAPSSPREAPPRPSAPAARPFAPNDAAAAPARRLARAAPTLEALEAALQDFDGCPLKTTATKLCFYRGATNARVMVIGEAPGRDEDLEGRPFVGRAGQLLDKMLAAIGLDEGNVHITNVVYWRPPGNRTPTPQETEACRPFLERQMELVAPEFVLLLGGAAAKQVLGVADGILRIRGRWRELEIGGRRVRAMPTLHPAYLLRTPISKRLAWRDLLAVAEALEEPPSTRA